MDDRFTSGERVEYVGPPPEEPDDEGSGPLPGELGVILWDPRPAEGPIVRWDRAGTEVCHASLLRRVSDGNTRGVTSVAAFAAELTEPWKPVVIAEANGFHMKVARLHGEFPWHVHEHEDELFHCTQGRFTIEMEPGPGVELAEGDVFVVPKGRRHRPNAAEPAVAVLFEPAETRQYGD